ncbi:MAG: response regulator [Geminicoccaceae bacterium]
MSSKFGQQIAPHLPYLRRYARALTGSQKQGDAYVQACLNAVLKDPNVLDTTIGAKLGLYRLFNNLWKSTNLEHLAGGTGADQFERVAQDRLQVMAALERQILLLTTLEQFTRAEVSLITGLPESEINQGVDSALADMGRQMATDVLIIEDEPMISLDLADIVEQLGHTVTTVSRTARDAMSAARNQTPGLVLADIQLADGSSGIDAVNEILGQHEVPVIFITAFPERLLTGERPEPAFLISKPFNPEMVKAAISQATFFKSSAAIEAR